MKCIVLYHSNYGYTERYARHIARELNCGLQPIKGFDPRQYSEYDTVIYGGGLYAGALSGMKRLTRHAKRLKDKRLVIFTCGLADPKDPKSVENIRRGLKLPAGLRADVHYFHFQGGIDYPRLGFVHNAMLTMMYTLTKKKDPGSLTEDDRRTLETYGKAADYTDLSATQSLIDYIKEG